MNSKIASSLESSSLSIPTLDHFEASDLTFHNWSSVPTQYIQKTLASLQKGKSGKNSRHDEVQRSIPPDATKLIGSRTST